MKKEIAPETPEAVPMADKITAHLKRFDRSSAQEIARAVGTTLDSCRDRLKIMVAQGKVHKDPVTFTLVRKGKK